MLPLYNTVSTSMPQDSDSDSGDPESDEDSSSDEDSRESSSVEDSSSDEEDHSDSRERELRITVNTVGPETNQGGWQGFKL